MKTIWEGLKQVTKYKSATLGLAIIGLLVAIAIYTVIAIPYSEAIAKWRGGEGVWRENPRNAMPSWVNLFPGVNLPKTIVLDSGSATKEVNPMGKATTEVKMTFSFEYNYDAFPKEIALVFSPKYETKEPFVALTWITPDGREFDIGAEGVSESEWMVISNDNELIRRLGGVHPEIGLFADPNARKPQPLKGTYTVVVDSYLFEEGADIDAKLIVYGRVHGLAGTDHRRRDITLALLWGTPIALAFGFLGALVTSVTSLIIAAVGVWYGRWVDAVIQRITEVRMILPVLPILIMLGTFYSKSLWLMLGAIIVLSIFGSAIKTNRAMFLQMKTAPYIEAAQSYGASNLRIVFRYLVPKAIPLLIPSFVIMIPSLVFLEASLAFIGLGDPVLPTWGKVLHDASTAGALYKGYYYWVLEPAFLLMLTGVGFTAMGFALDRIFNPRLREI
jgi:peptide/nickel transport system permease protein